MYYARGYCKNGSSCRFLHGVPEDDAAEREMAVMRAKALAAAPPTQQQQLMASAYPFSPSPKGGVSLSFLLQQQQQSETQRAAAGMLLGGEDMHRFPVRSPRMDRGDLIGSPAARQIYLTFPADSTFSEEDVSNYFSMFGPVQDVRIPYQQKRMFGFVTFVYAETVKAILSKGNPHFVCDARVLVKPYKEKGKVPDRFRKLEEEQAAELQQAIELEGRRFMGLQLLDLKSRGHHHLGSGAPMPLRQATDGKGSGINGNGNASHLEDAICIQDKRMMSSLAMSAPAAADAEGEHEEQQEEGGGGCDGSSSSSPKQAVNPGEEEVVESGPVTATPNAACGFQESSYGVVEVELVLPDSPFASPTKEEASYADAVTTAAARNGSISSSPRHVALFAPASSTTLELPPYSSSSFFQVPRFSRGHEAIGL
uniref:Nucleic acid binding protein n=1 Tax=Zea mays TaxID=4577 RepID=A0A804NYF7_MAIZE